MAESGAMGRMPGRHRSSRRAQLVVSGLGVVGLLLAGCTNPFAPDLTEPPKPPPPERATTATIAMAHLARSFNERDKNLYEAILDPAFTFTETDCRGDLIFENGFEEELEIMGSRDGGSRGIFDIYRTIEWDFQAIDRYTELGRDYPRGYEGDPDGHPEENWEVFRGRVDILLLETGDEGFRVTGQVLNIKLREGGDGLWRIVRWIDDPLSGDCSGEGEGASKQMAGALANLSWGSVKGR